MERIPTYKMVRELPNGAKVVKIVNGIELYNMNIFQNIMSWNQHNLDVPALEYFGNQISYGQLPQLVDTYSRGFKKMGVKYNDIVTMSLPVSNEYILSLFATANMGVISNNVNFLFLRNDLKTYTTRDQRQIVDNEEIVNTLKDKLEVVVQRIYQHYKGYSTIDEIRDMNIDGVSGGVSGLPESFLSQVAQTDGDYLEQVSEHKVPRACDSIWIFFQGKSIRLAFLSFGTEAELKRVCQNIYKYNNPGQLSDTNGFKINEMKDGSRVVVVRPSMCETWAFFVRKFDVKRATLEQIVKFEGKEETIELLKFLVKGARIIALTGEQGCRKNNNAYGYD